MQENKHKGYRYGPRKIRKALHFTMRRKFCNVEDIFGVGNDVFYLPLPWEDAGSLLSGSIKCLQVLRMMPNDTQSSCPPTYGS